MIISTLLFTVVLVTGNNHACAQKKSNTMGETAYIVIGASNNAATPNVPKVSNVFYFKNTQTKKTITLKVDSIQSFTIPPGDYILTEYRVHGSSYLGGRQVQTTAYVDFDFDKSLIEGSFSVAAGDAVYLGQVILTITKINPSANRSWGNNMYARTDLSKVEYTATVVNLFDKLDKEKFEIECGKTLMPKLLTWNKK